jgi:hypothetical protein
MLCWGGARVHARRPANWLHHVTALPDEEQAAGTNATQHDHPRQQQQQCAETSTADATAAAGRCDGSAAAAAAASTAAASPGSLSVSVNLWKQCPSTNARGGCNFAMGHIPYADDADDDAGAAGRRRPLPERRLRLQAWLRGVLRALLLPAGVRGARGGGYSQLLPPLRAGEEVEVVYPGPARRRYPARLLAPLAREGAEAGGGWRIEWADGDPEHREVRDVGRIYRRSPSYYVARGEQGEEGEEEGWEVAWFSVREPERAFLHELLLQRYAPLLRPGLLTEGRAWALEGLRHPSSPSLDLEDGAPADWGKSWAAELQAMVTAFEVSRHRHRHRHRHARTRQPASQPASHSSDSSRLSRRPLLLLCYGHPGSSSSWPCRVVPWLMVGGGRRSTVVPARCGCTWPTGPTG